MPKSIAGTFIDLSNTWMKRGDQPTLNDLEEMIQGPWAWSINGGC
jgi:hypothetical protein